MSKPKPLIIWTFRRTGGTNLAHAFFNLLDYPKVKHEPFNPDRVYGDLTKKWLENKNINELNAALDQIFSQGVLIKHCVELFDIEFNLALVGAAIRHGYNHLFLYRRNVLDRLMSLHFAQVTGVWGKGMLKDKILDGSLYQERIPVEGMIAHARVCNRTLAIIRQHLQNKEQDFSNIVFEDIYKEEDNSIAKERIFNLLSDLKLLSRLENKDAFAELVIGEGDQKTSDQYNNFVNYEKLKEQISRVKSFEETWSLVELKSEIFSPADVERSVIDHLPRFIDMEGGIEIGGVVVLKNLQQEAKRLVTVSDSGVRNVVEWGIKSPHMQKTFPDNPNAENARFRFFLKPSDRTIKLILEDTGSDAKEGTVIASISHDI